MGMETITISRAEYEVLKTAQARADALQQENNWLIEQIRLARSGMDAHAAPAWARGPDTSRRH